MPPAELIPAVSQELAEEAAIEESKLVLIPEEWQRADSELITRPTIARKPFG
jgi:hypothetical protein